MRIETRCALHALLLTHALSAFAQTPTAPSIDELLDKSIPELQAELAAGRTDSATLVRAYFDRIAKLDRAGPQIHAVLVVNPEALNQAKELDRERREHGARGPLHGIPILLKDNIESAEPMPTTAGSLALGDNVTGRDAIIVAHLRAAGAIVLGKTNLSEWANFRSDRSVSGWSGIGGLTKNPHVLDRSPCGSSAGSGAAIAAQFATAAVGTETDGSITCPASMNGIVGLKPTAGLLSQQGIVPIAHSQDTAGPMTRNVIDAALMLNAMIGDCVGGNDCHKVDVDSLAQTALQGKRIGVLRFRAGRYPAVDALFDRALQVLRAAGAILVDAQLPDNPRVRAAEETVLLTEFKADLNAYLATTPATVRTRTLAQLIEFNNANQRESALFGQELFVRAQATAGPDSANYKLALADSKRLAGAEGIAQVLAQDQLDFLVAPTTGPSWRIDMVNGDRFPGSFSSLPAIAGYPHLTMPMGDIDDLPVGMSFIGLPFSEQQLLGAAYVYEQRAHPLVEPKFRTSVEADAPALQPR